MGNSRVLSLVAALAALAGCGEQGGGGNAPPVGTSPGNQPPGTSGGSTSSGTGGSDSSTGGGACSVECPEDEMGTCPGHAEWTRGVVVWGLWESNNSGNRSIEVTNDPDDDPVCAGSVGVCIAYDHPSDIEGSEANLLAEQLAACNALNNTELAALGLADIPNVGAGWTLIHHWCTTGPNLDVTYQGQSYTTVGDSSLNSCAGDWAYEGFCSSDDCPIETGGSTSSGGVADSSSGGADSSSGGAAYDCSEVDASNVSVTTTLTDRALMLVERDAVIRRPLADLLASDPYTALYMCGDASISPSTKEIWHMGHTSILSSLGLAEDDIIVSVEGETDPMDMYDAVASAFLYGGNFDVIVHRGAVTIDYDVEVVAP